MDRLPGESLKEWKRRITEDKGKAKKEHKRQKGLYRQARAVYNEMDRSPDSDPYDTERPSF